MPNNQDQAPHQAPTTTSPAARLGATTLQVPLLPGNGPCELNRNLTWKVHNPFALLFDLLFPLMMHPIVITSLPLILCLALMFGPPLPCRTSMLREGSRDCLLAGWVAALQVHPLSSCQQII